MKYNEHTAISTFRVLLVPYDRRHVPTYHNWMEDPDIREATASERLSLEEEYENQESWRASHDKLTFIICAPLTPPEDGTPSGGVGGAGSDLSVEAGTVDAPERMIGDINFFLYPYDDDDNDDKDDEEEEDDSPSNYDGAAATSAGEEGKTSRSRRRRKFYVGEVDVMIASRSHRGKGVGKAAASAFLFYIRQNLVRILNEQLAATTTTTTTQGDNSPNPHGKRTGGQGDSLQAVAALKLFMVKIKADNEASVALFKSLGFVQDGEVNYFGEVKLVLRDVDAVVASRPEGYRELRYSREL